MGHHGHPQHPHQPHNYRPDMTILIALIIAALIFGIGGVLNGLLWAALIGVALIVIAGFVGRQALRR